ncbi:MAG: RNA polymerase sigma factor, partial [Verrucomicrobiales bacterium]
MSQNNFASHPPQIVADSGGTPESDLDRLGAFARAGDETAFRQIVEKYRRLVYSAALRRCGHRELAEEAMQNTFAVLARKSGHLLKHPTLSGWLHRTSMLEASTLLRGERTRRRKHSELMELETVQYSTGSSPSPASGPELDEALARLPARDRDVILMRFYEGMSFDEIGERLGKSNAACQKRSHRAVRKLSQLLAKPGSPAVGGAAVALAVSTQLADASPLSPAAAIADCAIARSSEVTI